MPHVYSSEEKKQKGELRACARFEVFAAFAFILKLCLAYYDSEAERLYLFSSNPIPDIWVPVEALCLHVELA